jgi:dTDP-4-dehydrorhamnose 3,5-epimerase
VRFTETSIPGVTIIDPTPPLDDRGRFMRAWCAREFAEHGIRFAPLQANMALSSLRGTLRGLHFQDASAPEAKLVRCTRGAMFDVAVDLRPDSPTFAKWFGVELTQENGRMLFLPELCAHGYQTLEDATEMHYMASAVYTPSAVRGVRFDDPSLKIQWPLQPTAISEQDRNWPLLNSTVFVNQHPSLDNASRDALPGRVLEIKS